ncbi:hypothetical protein LINPERPRIM_LOCUS18884 [Linum perenne]
MKYIASHSFFSRGSRMGQEIKNDLGGELGQAFIQKQGGACSSSSTEEHDVTTAVNKCNVTPAVVLN